MEEVIARFDKHLLTKASKKQFDDFKGNLDDRYVLNEDQQKFTTRIEFICNSQSNDLKQKFEEIYSLKQRIENKIYTEIKKLHNKVDGTHLESEAYGSGAIGGSANIDSKVDKIEF